jgi:hypothetical protein
MGRHSPRLSLAQRTARLALGVTTVMMLVAALWMMGRGGEAEEAPLAAGLPASNGSSSSTSETTFPTTTETFVTTITTVTTTRGSTTRPQASIPGSTPLESTTTTLAPLVLHPDGLGAIDLGAEYDTVVAMVTERLEEASSDSGWIAARGEFGTCPGTVVRVVRWDSLRLFFSDGPTEFAEEGRHLFYYSQSTVEADNVLDLATPEGIELGSTVEELQEAFGDDLTIESTISFGVNFVVDPPGPGLLSGNLTASSPDGSVTSIGGGFGCGA